MRKATLRNIVKLLPVILLLGITLALPQHASATAVGSNFNPGRIIDDVVFYDKDSMSVQDIQNWLNDMLDGNPNNGVNKQCDTNGTQMFNSTQTRAQWSAANGKPAPPYVCLRDYVENTTTHENNFHGAVTGGISAAQIIWNEAQSYNINPRVLLVLIQKESVGGVLTDDWPWESQYQSIAGFACPDSTPGVCDSTYNGFYNQMHYAARQFRLYANNPGNYNYIAGQNNNILYNPNAACGTLSVNIQNQATAGLYNYTPYVPNTAALNNLYGTGDGCSSYGNRNFWRFWTDWFGTTYVPTYNWSFVTQSSNKDLSNLQAGEKATLTLTAKNTGTATWRSGGVNPTRLGTFRNQDRSSAFYDPSWISPSRAVAVNQDVPPGGTGTFTFTIQAPAAGSYKEYFNIVVEGQSWLNDLGQHFPVTVTSSTFSGGTPSVTMPGSTIYPGNLYDATVTVQNTGNITWYRDARSQVRIGTASPLDRTSKFYDPSWIQATRPAALNEASVAPGSSGTFTFPIRAPSTPGSYTEAFSLVAEGIAWLNVPNFNITLNVSDAYQWQPAGQQAFTDGGKTTAADLSQLSAGQYVWLVLKAKNTGSSTWTKGNSGGIGDVRLATEGPQGRVSRFNTPGWAGTSRPGTFTETSVAPGSIGTFEFPVQVPADGFTGFERFNLVAEGTTWMIDQGVSFYMNVNTQYSWSFWSQFYYTDSSRSTPVDINNLAAGQTIYYGVILKNTGNTTWFNCDYYRATRDTAQIPLSDTSCTSAAATNAANRVFPVRLGTSNPIGSVGYLYDSSWVQNNRPSQLLNTVVKPGQLTSFEGYYTVPSSATIGMHRQYLQPVTEQITWMNDVGLHIPANVTH